MKYVGWRWAILALMMAHDIDFFFSIPQIPDFCSHGPHFLLLGKLLHERTHDDRFSGQREQASFASDYNHTSLFFVLSDPSPSPILFLLTHEMRCLASMHFPGGRIAEL